MKTLILTAILAVLSLVTPVLAQTTNPNIPQDQVEAKAKPFLGNWRAVACDPSVKTPYGLTFNIRIGDSTDDDGNVTKEPIFRILAISFDTLKPFDFKTLDFSEIVGDTPDKHFIWLNVMNASLVMNLQPAEPNARKDFVYGLVGQVETIHGSEYPIFAQQSPEKPDSDPWAYIVTLGKACPAPEQGDQAQLLRVNYSR